MRHLKLYLLLAILQFCATVKAQENETLCTKGLSYGEFISLFQIPSEEKLITILQQKCFEEYNNQNAFYTTFERNYEKSDYNSTTHYNELLTIKNGKALEYKCSELSVCLKLLRKINDNAIYFCQSYSDADAYIYILKDKQHVIEMRDIADEKIGYAYGFKYRDVTISDLNRFKESKLKDDFPKSSLERTKLEYRYARIYSYDNPTTITLNVGDKVYFEASGEITLGSWAGTGGVNGIEGYTSYNRVQGFKHGSLLYKIGASDWDTVTEEKAFVAKKSGVIAFTINDNDPSNNSGQFGVNIKIIRSK